MKWVTKFSRYVEDNAASLRELLLTLAQIPAPSGDEGKRAEFSFEFEFFHCLFERDFVILGNKCG